MNPSPSPTARLPAIFFPAVLIPALALAACTPTAPAPTPSPSDTIAAATAAPEPTANEADAGYPAGATSAIDAPARGGGSNALSFPFVARRIDVTPILAAAPPVAPTQLGADTAPIDVAAPSGTGTCAGILARDGQRLVLDGQPVTLFGVNATFLMDTEVTEAQIDPLLAALGASEVNTVRVWFFEDEDPDRFARLLDSGARYGVRFIVTLADNVFKGRDWFGNEEDEKRYRPHLKRTVERFKDRPEVLMWELINEPNCGDRHDQECLDTIKGWLRARAAEVKAIDACHLVSTGLIGAGNDDNDRTMYRRVHREPVIDVVSAHRRSSDESDNERDTAEELNKPILYGEVYDQGYDDGCNPRSDDALPRRAERIADDLRDAFGAKVAGYMLWDFAPGRIERTDGKPKDYCNKFGFQPDDPLWAVLKADSTLPPRVPWRPAATP